MFLLSLKLLFLLYCNNHLLSLKSTLLYMTMWKSKVSLLWRKYLHIIEICLKTWIFSDKLSTLFWMDKILYCISHIIQVLSYLLYEQMARLLVERWCWLQALKNYVCQWEKDFTNKSNNIHLKKIHIILMKDANFH